jgi:signal transduction histidine kinase
MKLKVKVVWLIALSLLLTIALMFALLYVVMSVFFPGYNHVKLQNMSEELAGRLRQTDLRDASRLAQEMAAFSGHHEGVGIDLFSGDGSLLHSSTERGEPVTLPEMMERLANPFHRMFYGEDLSMVYELDAGGEKLYAVFHVEGDAIQQMQFFLVYNNESAISLFFVPLLLIIALPALLAFVFIMWMTRRLDRLNHAMQRIDLTGEPVFLADKNRDEIGQLTNHYNEMIAKLHDQYRHIRRVEQARAELISRLSHDLRTPLAIIQGYAETLQRGSAFDTDTRIRHASIILQKTDYMNDLLHKLFSLARLDDPSQAFRKREGHLDSMLQTIMADYVLILNDKGIQWEMELPSSPVAATFNHEGLTQVIRNLLDNAIMHGGDGNYLGIRLRREGDAVRIDVEDRGKGIPAHKLANIFDPFYRVNEGRPGDGLGVGLTLAEAVVRQHGGRIEVASTPHERTVFSVIIPAGADAAAAHESVSGHHPGR